MPCAARLQRMAHVPGELFSVNPATARGVPGLFARNERVVCWFDTARGPMVLVLVGATIVGSMATVWHGVVNPPRPGQVRRWDYAGQSVELARGAEMGRFLLAPPWCCCGRTARCASTPAGRPAAPSAWARRWARRWGKTRIYFYQAFA
jgi:phosphatidylserine decarboxylase